MLTVALISDSKSADPRGCYTLIPYELLDPSTMSQIPISRAAASSAVDLLRQHSLQGYISKYLNKLCHLVQTKIGALKCCRASRGSYEKFNGLRNRGVKLDF